MTIGRSLGAAAAFAALLLLGTGWAKAQSLPSSPWPVSAKDGSGTIANTNTFQSVFAAQTQTVGQPLAVRSGCQIVNMGTHVMYVYPGPIANATTSNSFPLNPATSSGQAGGSFSCNVGGQGVVQDQISITGTSGDAFVAKQE